MPYYAWVFRFVQFPLQIQSLYQMEFEKRLLKDVNVDGRIQTMQYD